MREFEYSLNKPPANREEAVARINLIRQDTLTMGASDSENSSFEEILKRLDEGELSPVEAVGKALEIYESKQDYH